MCFYKDTPNCRGDLVKFFQNDRLKNQNTSLRLDMCGSSIDSGCQYTSLPHLYHRSDVLHRDVCLCSSSYGSKLSFRPAPVPSLLKLKPWVDGAVPFLSPASLHPVSSPVPASSPDPVMPTTAAVFMKSRLFIYNFDLKQVKQVFLKSDCKVNHSFEIKPLS